MLYVATYFYLYSDKNIMTDIFQLRNITLDFLIGHDFETSNEGVF